VRKLIGYCPQYNPIFESLTVQQNIDFFARIKGIPKYCRDSLIENVVDKLGLQNHKDKASGTLSGGNKRKLSVAIAIVGNPPIILLDEPSAGMDPEARRFMWSVVANIASQKTSAVILTSHLMEEAEALCTKMGIMVKGGVFKCFGST
jgi:ABC-type multidrug transport system ATPase subunit